VLVARMRGLKAFSASVALAAFVACAGEDAGSPRVRAAKDGTEALADRLDDYVSDPAVRRRSLEASLVRSDNQYARLRLEHYGRAWEELPELDPLTTPIVNDDAERGAPAVDVVWAKVDAGSIGSTYDELRRAGERAFFGFPVEVVPTIPVALRSEDGAGIWEHDGKRGVVWAKLAGDRIVPAFTCATCHATVEHGVVIAGKNNADIDLGRIHGDGTRGPSWRRGTVDVTGDDVDDPVAITDLRPLRWQENLHHAATLRNDPIALAVRIESLIVTSHGEAIRPPRKVVAALVAFLLDLAPKTALPDASSAGAAVFARECAMCHRGDGATGPSVPLDVVGTPPLVGRSRDRGTGTYRVPSLRLVGDRRRLFASGDIEDLDDLLTPSAERDTKGHRYGLLVDEADRGALLAFLRQL
jgi:hypothetical protein